MNQRKNRQPPETLRQAQWWENAKNHYVHVGLCHRCAAQAAWGHQGNAGGWSGLRPPCDNCAHIVRSFPAPTTNPLWRKFDRPQDHKRHPAAPLTPGEAVEDIDAAHSGQESVLL